MVKFLILKWSPLFIQNLAISIYNTMLYKVRRAGKYRYYREYFAYYENASYESLLKEQCRRLTEFLDRVDRRSAFHSRHKNKPLIDRPVLEKQDIINHLRSIATLPENKGIVSLTGGTTGASMKVIYSREDIQERQALLDHFRSKFGYELGKRVGWFSGKDLISEKDLSKGICYRDDWINRIRFFSTFHINDKNFSIYWEALEAFSPEFLVGFPSSIYELCVLADERGLSLTKKVKVFFPTAEVVHERHRVIINRVMGCKLIDQYASSEGAPFILECESGSLHMQLLSGVFEVIDENGEPSDEGELLVTSFSTRGTPLVRYRIGDSLRLSSADRRCSCGSEHPIVTNIIGRSSDFIWSPENGKVNLGNISNCTKDTTGIIQFQVQQCAAESLTVLMVTNERFKRKDKGTFLRNLQSRVGKRMHIELLEVDDIPREKSGKHRIVKNSLSADQMRGFCS